MSKKVTVKRSGKSVKKGIPDPEPVTKHCLFCGTEEENEDLLGKTLNKGNIYVHYFCMLLSSGLCQRGQPDKDDLYGFLPRDIQCEVKRGKKLSCNFCKNKGATIGCCVKLCRTSFHLTCGLASGTLHQFFGSYCSFCPTHRPRQASLTSDRLAFFGTANSTCAICMCAVEARASNETLRSPCCRSSWFHRNCIQRLATTAGLHYFKCPLCNNKDVFQEEMLEFGIYIPDQDAAWELDPNAYQELLERYNRCDALKCHCPRGRDYNNDASKWEILLCVCCGSQGSHVHCGQLPSNEEDWICVDCDRISQKGVCDKKMRKSKRGNSSTKSKLKAELKKEYEKLQEKAGRGHSKSKTADCADGSPCTSGFSKSTPSKPKVKNFPETVVRLTGKDEGEESNVDVDISDEDDISLYKLAQSSKRRLRSQNSQSSSKEDSNEEESSTTCFPNGELTVRVSPCKVQPGMSVSVTTLNSQAAGKGKKRKTRASLWSKGKQFVSKKGLASKKKKLQKRMEHERSVGSESVTDSSFTASGCSTSSPVSFKLSPAVIERIRAPSPSFSITEPSPGDSEVQESGSEVSSTLPEKSQHLDQNNHKYKRKGKGRGVTRKPLDLSLLEVVTLSEDESDDELVSSTTKGDPLPVTCPDQYPGSLPFSISQPYTISQQPLSNNDFAWPNLVPIMPIGEPEFIDLDTFSFNETQKDENNVPRAESSNEEKPLTTSQVLCTKTDGNTDEVLTISSTSEDDEDEVVFISQNLKKPQQYTQHLDPLAGCLIPTSFQSPNSIITPRGLRLLPARRPPNLINTISTSSVMTSKGLRLIRPPVNLLSYPINNNPRIVNQQFPQGMSPVNRFAQPFSTNQRNTHIVSQTISCNKIAGANGLSQTFVLPNEQPSQEQYSHPSQNTRSHQPTALVIDLTEEDVNMSNLDETSPENASNATVAISQFYNSSINDAPPTATESPLKINLNTLQSIRSVVCNTTNGKFTNEGQAAEPDADKSLIICEEPAQQTSTVQKKPSKLSLRKTNRGVENI